jgi:transcriptional regulator with GAF, ATPase, and Fis domain
MANKGNVTNSKGDRTERAGRRQKRNAQFSLTAEPLPKWREAKGQLEQWMLEEALGRTNGNMAAAGRLLGITKVAVLHAVRRHGLVELTRGQQE